MYKHINAIVVTIFITIFCINVTAEEEVEDFSKELEMVEMYKNTLKRYKS